MGFPSRVSMASDGSALLLVYSVPFDQDVDDGVGWQHEGSGVGGDCRDGSLDADLGDAAPPAWPHRTLRAPAAGLVHVYDRAGI